ncbi:MAG: tetratricopeptide repeat protein [Acidiferrobacterales bacterium]|nr:tetratricopeptide repeat protein [Acidiferrobacterales bacterium]
MKLIAKLIFTSFLALLFPVSTFADGGGSSVDDYKHVEPLPAKIERLIDSEQYERAEEELKIYVKKEKKNPDAWNWLGFSQRLNGDLDGSLKSYKKALRLDKKHLGAHEYLGELYIMRGEMKKAKKQLKKLAKLCGDCEQYQKLSAAIEKAS